MKILTTKSKTVNWGHVQMVAGAVATALAFVTPAVFDDLPKWVYGAAAMVAATITYVLRNATRKPLDDK